MEPSYHTTNVFHRISISDRNEKKKSEILMNHPVCLGLSILELSQILMHEFWLDYVKPKCCEKAKLCYMNTNWIHKNRWH